MFIVLTNFWFRWALLHIWLSFTIHYFIIHFECYNILNFAGFYAGEMQCNASFYAGLSCYYWVQLALSSTSKPLKCVCPCDVVRTGVYLNSGAHFILWYVYVSISAGGLVYCWKLRFSIIKSGIAQDRMGHTKPKSDVARYHTASAAYTSISDQKLKPPFNCRNDDSLSFSLIINCDDTEAKTLAAQHLRQKPYDFDDAD